MRIALAFVVTSLALPAGTRAQTAALQPAAPEEAARTITAEDLRARIGALAHDSMRGRDTPSPELEETARYVATKFRTFGLQPGADGEFFQRYPLTFVAPGEPSAQRLELRGPAGPVRLDPRTEFIALPVGPSVEGRGPIVVVSTRDETTDLAGRVALVPVDRGSLQGALARTRELLGARKAEGVLLALDAPPGYVSGVRRFFESERISLGEPDAFPAPVMIVARSALPASLREGLRAERVPAGWTARLRAEGEVRREEAVNTIGWLEGSDPELRDEYIVFTAHMDHVGVGRPVDGDSIYNGADDDASGTATVVELAQAFATTEPRPRRSLVFMTVSGEEKGLLGSRWYSEHPTFPLDRTVANLNMDMIGRNWEDTVVAIGKEESTLGATVDRVAADHPDLGLAVIDDLWPEERFYFRSDHFNFARKGVPILFFFSGVHEDYHEPSDEAHKIGYEKTARIGRLIYFVGLEVANADEPPEWDPEAYRRVVEEAEGGR